MKARIIHTKFYESERVLQLSCDARWLFMYYLTCSGIGLTGAFKWANSKTLFETALTQKRIDEAKKELSISGLVHFSESWVIVPDTEKKTGFANGSSITEKAYLNEFSSLPEEIKEIIKGGHTPAKGYKGVSIPPEIRNKKLEIKEKGIVKGKSPTGRAVAEHIISVFNQATGKNYSLTDKRCKLIADRLKSFPSEQLVQASKKIGLSPFHMGENDRHWMADPDWLFRNDENVDKAINLTVTEKKNIPVRLGYKAQEEGTYETN